LNLRYRASSDLAKDANSIYDFTSIFRVPCACLPDAKPLLILVNWHIAALDCVEFPAVMKAARSLWGDREGSVLIEATVLTPMLFVFLFGVFEFSFVFFQQQLIEAGVRDAARYLARIGPLSNGATPCTQVDPATASTTYLSYAQNIALYGQTSATGGTQRVAGWTGPVTITCPTSSDGNTYADGTSQYTITATTSFTDPTLGMFGYLGLNPPAIAVTHKERYIGPG
jgi:Flp pilus assembly protein TadG